MSLHYCMNEMLDGVQHGNDKMTEKFNPTLKSMLKNHADKYDK